MNLHPTVLEISKAALLHNYQYLRSKLQNVTGFMAVVKARGYGSSDTAVAHIMQDAGVDYFAVAYASEGIALREAGITKPILVLHPQVGSFKTLIEHCLEPAVYSVRVFSAFAKAAQEQKQSDYPIHIKINTGLNRLGFSSDEVTALIKSIAETPAIKVKSIFSHLAASEDPAEADFTRKQISKFTTVSEQLMDSLSYTPFRHMTNTSGILNFPEAHFDMVRSGIGLYGYGNDVVHDKNLIPACSLKTIISQIHEIKAGDTVGYNRAFTASKDIRVATLPLGHADGFTRIYGKGKGKVRVADVAVPIIGNVAMDMVMIDVTDVACNEGDTVVIFDKQNPASTLAEAAGTISYELLTDIGPRVRRKLV